MSYHERVRLLPLLLAFASSIPAAAAPAAGYRASAPPRIVQAPARPAPSDSAVCRCAAHELCWDAAMASYAALTKRSAREAEGSTRGRFFPRASASARRELDAEGHFIDLRCGGKACPEERAALEARIVYGSFLLALPLGLPEPALRDPSTWVISARGESMLREAKRCRKDLVSELVAGLRRGFPSAPGRKRRPL